MSTVLPPLTPRHARAASPTLPRTSIPWARRVAGVPYSELDGGISWTPIGANEAITWPDLAGLYRRRDLPGVESHLRDLRAQGVTVLRLMLEYAHHEHRYLERPVGRFVPAMVRLWDDLFALCEAVGMRILLTPFDTFFLWQRWAYHPYNRRHGGPCADRTQLLSCAATRAAVKRRLAFASERWGNSGALFAWDLWNELHPALAGGDYFALWDFVSDVSATLRALEIRLHGRAHLQTVSFFGPDLLLHPEHNELVFRHPGLDFASTHFYARGTIDDPRDTVAAAAATGLLVQQSIAEIRDMRPFLDSEHGPIHRFKDLHQTLPAPFDDEYFRHMQWAHLASGGAGGGMRWPNRHPHTLTPGMRAAQRALSAFLPLIDWSTFRRRDVSRELVLRDCSTGWVLPIVAPHLTTRAGRQPTVRLAGRAAVALGCADDSQAVVYLLAADRVGSDGRLRTDMPPRNLSISVPGLGAGRYRISEWDTLRGAPRHAYETEHTGGNFTINHVALATDVALAITRVR
ncbi:MAG: hypothetical protein V4617_17525 [Gemmatimonadota bacterium]